jgi:hypothetical protein
MHDLYAATDPEATGTNSQKQKKSLYIHFDTVNALGADLKEFVAVRATIPCMWEH